MIFGKYINRYYKKYWYLFLLVLLNDAIVDIVQLLIPMIIGNLVTVFSAKEGELGTEINTNPFRIFTGFTNPFTINATDTLPFYQTDFFLTIITTIIVGVIIFVGRMLWRFSTAQIGANIERDLRTDMFSHIQKMSLSYYSQKKVGGLLSYFTNDIQTIKQCFTEGLIFMTDLLVLGSCSIILMALLSWQITLYTCIPLLLFIVLGGVIGSAESKRYKISSDAFEDMSDFTEENLQGFAVIKAFKKEKDRVIRFRRLTDKVEDTSVHYLRFSSLVDLSINCYLAATFGVLFFLCGYSVIVNGGASFSENIKNVGDLSKFTGYYDSLIWPMIAGGMLIDYVSRGNGARKRIATILDSKPEIIDDNNPVRDELKGDIIFNHLNFTYPDDTKENLKDINFHITPGMNVGIIGKTGSGKSTLVSLLCKLYNIPRGMLIIDGVDINDWRKKDLREHIGFVSQEAFLFSGTVESNIAFAEPSLNKVDEDKVIASARFADVENDINSFPNGFKTVVGEKGATLSGGQRQRVSIARAIYKNPSLLVLDDSLSAVDADTEKNILSHFRDSKNKITSFVIAHRISAIEDSDLILVMDHGEIIGQGKHEELIETCPLYRDLVKLQNLEKEVEND